MEVYPDGVPSVDPYGWKHLLENMSGFFYSQNFVLNLWEGPAKTM